MAQLLEGRRIAQHIREEIRAAFEEWRGKALYPPGLAVVLVGEDPASMVYVRNKQKACAAVDITSFAYLLSSTTSENELLELITELNTNKAVHGILVQLPLPKHIREGEVVESIAPEKDVDGFHPLNVARLFSGDPFLIPCTPAGVMELLERSAIPLTHKRVVIVGSSNIVGKPLMLLLLKQQAIITLCHKYTRHLAEVTREADILITAVGKPNLITAEMVKPGVVIIDIGINFFAGKTVGDVDFEGVFPKASLMTPVPGGVGPVTIAMLLRNTLRAYRAQQQ
jgi:methylenetetrahydrofolate dehydrogenase (NADP+)/methenyltetrahydrofolate cyclohydrolase